MNGRTVRQTGLRRGQKAVARPDRREADGSRQEAPAWPDRWEADASLQEALSRRHRQVPDSPERPRSARLAGSPWRPDRRRGRRWRGSSVRSGYRDDRAPALVTGRPRSARVGSRRQPGPRLGRPWPGSPVRSTSYSGRPRSPSTWATAEHVS